MSTIEKIAGVLDQTEQVRIGVFGDFALDKYLYIDHRRDEPSVETGLTAFQVHSKGLFAGVGGTIANNLRALGAQVVCFGLTGEDGEGYELRKCLTAIGADVSGLMASLEICTCTYTKPMGLQEDGSYVEMNRLDFRNFSPAPEELQKALLERLEGALPGLDAVLLTDQYCQRNLGVITDGVRQALSDMAKRHPEILFYADSRAFIREFHNMIVKCNNFELMAGSGDPEDPAALLERASGLGDTVFITRGSQGMLVLSGGQIYKVPAFRVEGPIDIVGAGDASNAGIVLGMALGLKPQEAAVLGCCVSSITIQQIGVTGTASVDQVRRRLREYQGGIT